MSFLAEGMANYQAAVAELPQGVQSWMWFMRAFLMGGGLLFVLTRPGAIVFAVMVANALLLWTGMAHSPTQLHTIGPALHLVLWVPLVIWLVWYLRRAPQPQNLYQKAARVWLMGAVVIMLISLVLDAGSLIAGTD